MMSGLPEKLVLWLAVVMAAFALATVYLEQFLPFDNPKKKSAPKMAFRCALFERLI